MFLPDSYDKVVNYGKVEEEDNDPGERGMALDVKEFQRNERGRDEGGEPLGPGFQEPQAQTLR